MKQIESVINRFKLEEAISSSTAGSERKENCRIAMRLYLEAV